VTEHERKRRGPARAFLAALRPRQWTKNIFVFAALVLTGELGHQPQTLTTLVTFLVFCAVSSAVYLLNDVADVDQDRRHPVKRQRPLAAGELSPWVALAGSLVLAVGGVAVGFWVGPVVGAVVVAYLLLQVAYTFALKHLVIVEVLAIAGGFVLRVLAGGAAIHEPISPYLYLSMIFLALFQGFAKRRQELQVLADAAGHHRQSLNEYTIHLLDQFILIAATATIVTYSTYAITTPARPAWVSANMLLLTIPFVLYAVFRYLYLVQVQGKGGAPEDILLTDKLLLLDVLAWGASLIVILYVLPYLA
jgi:4-hydroxybenzoate polyprenyltransferase